MWMDSWLGRGTLREMSAGSTAVVERKSLCCSEWILFWVSSLSKSWLGKRFW